MTSPLEEFIKQLEESRDYSDIPSELEYHTKVEDWKEFMKYMDSTKYEDQDLSTLLNSMILQSRGRQGKIPYGNPPPEVDLKWLIKEHENRQREQQKFLEFYQGKNPAGFKERFKEWLDLLRFKLKNGGYDLQDANTRSSSRIT